MPKFFLSLVFCVSTLAVCAQTNYVSGNVVLLTGDTLKGQVNDQLWNANPTEVELRDVRGQLLKFLPEELKGFSVSGRLYRSFRVRYDSASKKYGQLSGDFSPNYKESHLFLKVLIDSRYSLLEFLDPGERIHYFIQNGDKAEELINHLYMNMLKMTTHENKLYIGQLRAAFADCPELKVTDRLSYNKESIKKLFIQYDECKGISTNQAQYDKVIKTRTSFGLTGNFSLDKFQSDFDQGLGYGYGLFVNFNPAHKLYKVSYRLEFTTHKFPEDKNYYDFFGRQVDQSQALYYQHVKISSFKVVFAGRVRFDESKRQSYFTFGVTDVMFPTVTSAGTYGFGANYGAVLGGLIGAGTYFGNYSPEIRFEIGAAGYKSLQCVLSYSLLTLPKTRK